MRQAHHCLHHGHDGDCDGLVIFISSFPPGHDCYDDGVSSQGYDHGRDLGHDGQI